MSNFDRDKCIATMKKLSDKIKDRVAVPIYHYTKAEAFKSIIESKEIWMTNALFVNDTTELRASLEEDIFKDVQFINREFNVFKNESRRLEPKDVEDYYLACFSKEGDSLYQFCAYGNYCIGFDAKKLKKNRFNLFRCVYEQKDIKDWIIKQDKLADWKDECFDNEKGKSYKESALYNVKYARQAKLKNKHYESEHELRLLAVSYYSWDSWFGDPYCSEWFCDRPAIYFRNHKLLNVPVPYVKFFIPKNPKTRKELEEMVKGKSPIEAKQIIRDMEMKQERQLLPIDSVTIGPMPHQQEAVLATKIFLRGNGYDKVDVIRSDIPFRGK